MCGLVFQNDIFTEECEHNMFTRFYDTIPEQNIKSDNDVSIYKEIDLIKKLLGNPTTLDFGSFWGKFALTAQTWFPVYCYEIGMKKYEYHKKLGLRILDKIDRKFDLIRVGNVLSHLHNNLITILNTLIENATTVFIIDWDGDTALNEFMPQCSPLWHVNTFTSESLEYLRKRWNLRQIYRENFGDHFGVFYGKQQ